MIENKDFVLQKSPDLRNLGDGIENQGQVGDCTAFALTNVMEMMAKRSGHNISLSAYFNYKTSRDMFGGGDSDEGSFLHLSLAAATNGVASEQAWESTDIENVNLAPNANAIVDSQNYQVTSWEKLNLNPDSAVDRIHLINEKIAEGYPVYFAGGVDKKFMIENRPIEDQIFNNPTMSTQEQYAYYGRHAVVGEYVYKENTVIENQWGESWGDHGYGVLNSYRFNDEAYIITGLKINGISYDFKYTEQKNDVCGLYASIFNRSADLNGMNFWVSCLQAGQTLSTVAAEMIQCTAADSYFKNATNEKMIDDFYVNTLGRHVDTTGSQYWSSFLQTHSKGETITTIMNAVVDYNGWDVDALHSKDLFMNKVAVSTYNSIMCADNNISIAEHLFDNITYDPVTVTSIEIDLIWQLLAHGWA